MESEKKMTGIQRLFMTLAVGAAEGYIIGYETMSEEDKAACNKKIANRMFTKACTGKLDEPYTEYEIEFIKENL